MKPQCPVFVERSSMASLIVALSALASLATPSEGALRVLDNAQSGKMAAQLQLQQRRGVARRPDWESEFVNRLSADQSITNRTGKLLTLGDGGFSLKVTSSSMPCSFPKSGDTVTVHYIGTLEDGKKFDSSRDRGEPIQFVLGRGKVIRGWDQGIKMMCLGEHGVLHVPSYKGYGTSGAPPAIPPSADLDFDVELLGINNKFAPQYEPPAARHAVNASVALGAKSASRSAGERGALPAAGAALAAVAGSALLVVA